MIFHRYFHGHQRLEFAFVEAGESSFTASGSPLI